MVRANLKGIFPTYNSLGTAFAGPTGTTAPPVGGSTASRVRPSSSPTLPPPRS